MRCQFDVDMPNKIQFDQNWFNPWYKDLWMKLILKTEIAGIEGEGAIQFSKSLWFLLPGSQSSYFASKKAQEKYQIPKLKTVRTQNCLSYIKSWFFEILAFLLYKITFIVSRQFLFFDLILLPGLSRCKIRWLRPWE